MANTQKVDTQVYANFATASRLVASLVSEGICLAYFLPVISAFESCSSNMAPLVGIALLLRHASDNEFLEPVTLSSNVLLIVPLRSLPILHPNEAIRSASGSRCFPRIELVDSWEMIGPHLFTIRNSIANGGQKLRDSTAVGNAQLHEVLIHILAGASGASADTIRIEHGLDAVQLWLTVASRQDLKVPSNIVEEIRFELRSSIDFQQYNYEHPKRLPTLESSSIEWEQCNFEGHPTHPMHKLRMSYPPMPPLTPGMIDLDNPRIRLVSFPRQAIHLRGDFKAEICGLVKHMLGDSLEPDVVYLPVHEIQVQTLLEKFPVAQVVNEVRPVWAHSLTSLRSLAIPELLPGKSLKLGVGARVSGALRTISPVSAYSGPGFSKANVPYLSYDRNILTIQCEVASAVARHEDPHIAGHAGCIVRDSLEYGPESEHDLIVPCASLVERIQQPNTSATLVTHVFGLETEESRRAFLARYVDLILRAVLQPAITNGVAFEAHGQNTLARFDRATGELKGFLIRGFGAIRVHVETLKASTGVPMDVAPTSPIIAKDLSDLVNKLYHSLFLLHLQRLIRVLDLYSNGFGWRCVREALDRNFPNNESEIYKAIRTQKRMPVKCFVRMKMAGLEDGYIWNHLPNLVLYEPQKVALDGSVSIA
ncbi:hypothetical protein L211DRAFT_835324 [Terfezia boudieri ATCC MYA-4762]|uniref:Aerobactin siderophore biosynthesis IucA/IucC N-terminal domain-containing protein n=1 Tax=Terfezia boudieri ATCC MYA-4762 TaxID=1051890 RepID=A0A3N4LUL4_9PEZI|nr:hypothetical protein L211DRAFT_835324 [Terfezia boudieri ATCC MYA-4762]